MVLGFTPETTSVNPNRRVPICLLEFFCPSVHPMKLEVPALLYDGSPKNPFDRCPKINLPHGGTGEG